MPQTIFDDAEGTLAMLRDSVATLASRQPGPASIRRKRAAGADTDAALWAAMAEAGWTGILVPEALGGAGGRRSVRRGDDRRGGSHRR